MSISSPGEYSSFNSLQTADGDVACSTKAKALSVKHIVRKFNALSTIFCVHFPSLSSVNAKAQPLVLAKAKAFLFHSRYFLGLIPEKGIAFTDSIPVLVPLILTLFFSLSSSFTAFTSSECITEKSLFYFVDFVLSLSFFSHFLSYN